MPRRDGDARALRGRGISPAAPTTGNALVWNGSAWAPGAGGGGGSPSIDVLQANSYVDGQAVYFDGALWQLAQADAAATLGLGVLTNVIQSPDPAAGFTVVFSGPIAAPAAYPLEAGAGTLTAGQYYFVSASVAGTLTPTEPSGPTEFSNPILFAVSAAEAIVLPYRPSAVAKDIPPLIIPLGGVMGDSSGTWATGGGVSIDWSQYAGIYATWNFTAITVCSGGGFSTGVQLLDQTNATVLATIVNNSTVPVANVAVPPLGTIPGAGTFLYLAQVQIVGTLPQPSDRAVLLSSYITLLP